MKAVNLIPNEQRGPAKAAAASPTPSAGGSGFGAYAILALLAFAVVAAALYVTTGNGITEKKSELAQVEQQAEAVQAQAASLQSFADFKNLSASRESTVRDIATSRFDWDVAMDDVSRALPSDVFISMLDGTTSSASGGSSIRGAIAAPAIQITGCTQTQSNVAQLMTRLRNVRGVTRVSLASSVSPDDAAVPAPAPASTEGGAKTISQPCPKGSPPAFDMVVFFERAVIPAGAQTNTAAVTTGPTTTTSGAPTGPTAATGVAAATTPATVTTP